MKAVSSLIALMLISTVMSLGGCSKSQNNGQGNAEGSSNYSERKKDLNRNIYDIKVKTMDGSEKSLSEYNGKVLLIVNVASKCGYTPQYEALEKIYEEYGKSGLEILAFPCNDFGGQEPGTNDEIRTFCETKYNVTFPLFDKVKVLGNDKSALYDRLTNNSDPAGDVQWNFEKFLIDRKGNIAARFRSKVKPDSEEFRSAVVKLIQEQ